jgi:hypothetical protein
MTTRVDNNIISIGKLKPDQNGWLKIPNIRATRAGIFKYKDAQGNTVRELRPRDEVFNEESMNSLSLVPFSIEHNGGLLTPDTVEKYQAGSVGDTVRKADPYVEVSASATRKDAVDKIMKLQHLDVSAGYKCEIEEKSGVDPEFGAYDRIQRNIRYNHLTSTARGRGEGCSIRLDAWMVNEDQQTEQNPSNEEKIMHTTKIQPYFIGEKRFDSIDVAIPDEAKAQFEALQGKLEEASMEANSQISAMQAKLDSAESKASENTEEAITAKAKEMANVMFKEQLEKQEVLSVAEKKLDSAVFATVKDQSAIEIKKAVLEASGRFKKERFDSEAYIEAGYDQLLEEPPSQKGERLDYEDPRLGETMTEQEYIKSLIKKGA